MNKTGIEFVDATWNPVTGCLHPCRDTYCYAARLARTRLHDVYTSRYPARPAGTDPVLLAGDPSDPFAPRFWPHRLQELTPRQKPKRIFVGDMSDVFGKWVPDDVIWRVLAACNKAPQHTYLFLTKNAGRYRRLPFRWWPPQTWLGATTDVAVRMRRWLSEIQFEDGGFGSQVRFWTSAEPLREDIADNLRGHDLDLLDWLIVGGVTGQPKPADEAAWARALTITAKLSSRHPVQIFEKSNLGLLNPAQEIPADPPSGG